MDIYLVSLPSLVSINGDQCLPPSVPKSSIVQTHSHFMITSTSVSWFLTLLYVFQFELGGRWLLRIFGWAEVSQGDRVAWPPPRWRTQGHALLWILQRESRLPERRYSWPNFIKLVSTKIYLAQKKCLVETGHQSICCVIYLWLVPCLIMLVKQICIC